MTAVRVEPASTRRWRGTERRSRAARDRGAGAGDVELPRPAAADGRRGPGGAACRGERAAVGRGGGRLLVERRLRLPVRTRDPAAGGDGRAAGAAGRRRGRGCGCALRCGFGSRASLQSRSEEEVLNGANVGGAALGRRRGLGGDPVRDGRTGRARRVSARGLLRGQAGTDAAMPAAWPAGTEFVLLDGALQQVDLPASARGLARHFRVGPATRTYDDPSYVHHVEAFEGVGLRPYRPVHLRVATPAGRGGRGFAGYGGRGSTATAGSGSTCRWARRRRATSSASARRATLLREATVGGSALHLFRRRAGRRRRRGGADARGGPGLGPLRAGTL